MTMKPLQLSRWIVQEGGSGSRGGDGGDSRGVEGRHIISCSDPCSSRGAAGFTLSGSTGFLPPATTAGEMVFHPTDQLHRRASPTRLVRGCRSSGSRSREEGRGSDGRDGERARKTLPSNCEYLSCLALPFVLPVSRGEGAALTVRVSSYRSAGRLRLLDATRRRRDLRFTHTLIEEREKEREKELEKRSFWNFAASCSLLFFPLSSRVCLDANSEAATRYLLLSSLSASSS